MVNPTTSPSSYQPATRQAITAMSLMCKGLGTTSKARPGGGATLVGGLNIRKPPELTQKGIRVGHIVPGLCYNVPMIKRDEVCVCDVCGHRWISEVGMPWRCP